MGENPVLRQPGGATCEATPGPQDSLETSLDSDGTLPSAPGWQRIASLPILSTDIFTDMHLFLTTRPPSPPPVIAFDARKACDGQE